MRRIAKLSSCKILSVSCLLESQVTQYPAWRRTIARSLPSSGFADKESMRAFMQVSFDATQPDRESYRTSRESQGPAGARVVGLLQ